MVQPTDPGIWSLAVICRLQASFDLSMVNAMTIFWVTLGSGLGGACRFLVAAGLTARFGASFPWGTLAVNVLGSFLIGVLTAVSLASERWASGQGAFAFAVVGFCGGFTTFSTFSLQTLQLIKQNQYGAAIANIGVSVLVCLFFTAAGFVLGKVLMGSTSQ